MKRHIMKNEEGFTLVEVIAVLIILGILAAVAVPKYIGLEENAKERAIDAGVSELNGRESMYWAKLKISPTGTAPYTAGTLETAVWGEMTKVVTGSNAGTDLNITGGPTNYAWTTGPNQNTDSTLTFQGGPVNGTTTGVVLCRSVSTLERPANWRRGSCTATTP